MTLWELLRGRLAFFLSVLGVLVVCLGLAWIFNRGKPKKELAQKPQKSDWGSLYGILSLPVCFAVLLAAVLLFRPEQAAGILHTGAQYFLTYAVYSLLLLALLPLLRRRYSAECCALLWTLPDLSVYSFRLLMVRHLGFPPLIKLRLGRTLFITVLVVWAAGFLAVLGWKLCSHLRFRRRLLKDTVSLTEEETRLYREEREALAPKPPVRRVRAAEAEPAVFRDASLTAVQIDRSSSEGTRYELDTSDRQRKRLPAAGSVLRSAAADTPLAIGLFRRTTRIVLPMREYADGELRLIFRHELCHLLRGDNAVKLFMTLQTALGWFLPSMWLGMERSAQDTELACDELATKTLPQEERKNYAALLLDSAGEARGFTTCLTASASGLRYRLGRVLHPKKRRSGIVLMLLVLSLFLTCFSTVGFAVEAGTVRTAIFDRYPDAALEAAQMESPWGWLPCGDLRSLHQLLDGRKLYRDLSEDYVLLGKLQARLLLDDDADLELYENGALVRILRKAENSWSTQMEYYLFDESFDWQSISYLFEPDESS